MTVTTRRERRERERRRQQSRRTGGGGPSAPRGISQIWVILGVVAAVIALTFAARAAGVFDPPATAKLDVNSQEFEVPAGEVIGTKLEDLRNTHITTGQQGTYNSVPPTSGTHWGSPQAPAPWGIKETTLPNEVTVHNLEHGGIVIAYNALTREETDQLKSLVRQLMSGGFPKIILEPYPDLKDAKIALTAWTWIHKLPGFDQTQIVRFFRAHYDPVEAPERGIP